MPKPIKISDGFTAVWSPVNRAYLVLFGTGPVAERSVLRILPDADAVKDYALDLGVRI